MRDRLFELATLDAVGALASAERAELARLLPSASEALRRDVAAIYDAAAPLPAERELETPSPSVRARIMSHAARRST